MRNKKVGETKRNRRPARLLARIFLAFLTALCAVAAAPVHAASCWAVTGWSSSDYVGAQAIVTPASCSTTPQDQGWVHVTYDYSSPPNDDLWLRISLNDSRVSNWLFQPLLVFSHYDLNGKPVVITDLLVSYEDQNYMWLVPHPPVQGVPVIGSRVRLRHQVTGKCAYSVGQNGASVSDWDCWNDAAMVYVIDDAGGGLVRLRHEQTGQCLYAVNQNGASLHNWGCWSDPNMAFALDPAGGGYRLRHVSSGQCPYGNPTNGGAIHTWGCWGDPAMVFNIDIIN
jgi:Ricin-type beta-trefoil lectin domain-like